MKKCILFLICSFIISINGCGNKNEVSGDKKDEQKKNESAKEKSENKSEELTKKEEAGEQSKEELSKSNELGMTPGLPANFPIDIPKPLNAKTLGSINTSEGTVVTFESTDKVQDVVNYFKEEMKKNGFVISEGGETLVSDKGGLISWTKDKRQVGLMLGFDKDKNITSLVITYTP